MNSLDGPRLKLRRAEKHLNAVKAMIDGFIANNPYTFIVEPNLQPPNYVIIARVNQIAPDDELSVIIGDFAHNARSALDLLVYQLSNLPFDDGHRYNLYFPIFDTEERYRQHVQQYLAGVSPEYTAIIEGFQPYKRADGFDNDALGILCAINNADKHRIVHVIGAIANFSGLGFSEGIVGTNIISGPGIGVMIGPGSSVDFGGGFTCTIVGDGVITKDGTVVARLTSSTPSQMNMHPEAEILVKFGVGNLRVEGRPVVDTLTFIYDRVKEVIGKFECAFPK